MGANKSRKMAEEDVQKCMKWLFQQQGEIENSDFGFYQTDVLEALKQQRSREQTISEYRQNIEKLIMKHQLKEKDSRQLTETYGSVKAVSSKRSSCMEVLSGIATLEDPIEDLAAEFDARSVHLVNMAENNKQAETANSQRLSNESMAKASQNCIVAVRNNWRWISTVMQCAQVHLHNAGAYQEFFHEVEEADYWMDTTLSRMQMTFDRSKLSGDKADASQIKDEMKDVLIAFLQWQGRVEGLFDRAKNIVPVPSRLTKNAQERPVVALADYKSSEIEFREGETLTLLDNSDRTRWMVKNTRAQTSMVPAIVLVIPAPASAAVDVAIKLRLQLLALWTMSIKRLGTQIISFMLIVFREWSDEEKNDLKNMSKAEKDELLAVISHIELSMAKNWDGNSEFGELKSRLNELKTILNQPGTGKGSSKNSKAVVQIKSMEELIQKYKDFWAFWETFKVIVELVREPKHLLVCDNMDQLKFVSTAHFIKLWNASIDERNGSMTKLTNGVPDSATLTAGSTVTSDSTVQMLNGEGVSNHNVTAITFVESPRKPFPSQEDRLDLKRNGVPVEEMVSKTTTTDSQSMPTACKSLPVQNGGQEVKEDMIVQETMTRAQAANVQSAMDEVDHSTEETITDTKLITRKGRKGGKRGEGDDDEWEHSTEETVTDEKLITTKGRRRGKRGEGDEDEWEHSTEETITDEKLITTKGRRRGKRGEGDEDEWEHSTEETITDETLITTTTRKGGRREDEEEEEEEEEVWETTEETTTEDVSSSTVVEAQTLVLTEALNTKTNKFENLTDATRMGILDHKNKQFVDLATGKRISLNDAINDGLVKYEFKSKKTLKTETKSYGLMTIRSTKDNRPFTIQKVLDPKTDEEISVAEACDRGIMDRAKNKYITENGESMSILDAIFSGLIKAEFKEEEGGAQESTEVVEKTYAVYGVVDQRRKCTVTFSEAIRYGILDCQNGIYIQNVTKNKIPVSEAIMRGFMKARFVTDPSKLDGDPSHNVVVERLANTKSKILRAVRAARAFQNTVN